jgi:type I restriction enzyme S subunit
VTAYESVNTDEEWAVTVVGDCLDTSRSTSSTTVPTSDYRQVGKFPIVDQSTRSTAGWTDNADAVVQDGLPLVIFGDHTRALKYVDFPFARGADGTQLLRTRPGIDTKFFYYACRQLDLPSRGYNRHFTLLREQQIRVPRTIEEQRDVARALGCVERAIEVEERLAAFAEELKAALLTSSFTRGMRGARHEETEHGPGPRGWVEMQLSDLGEVVTGTTPPTKEAGFYDGGVVPFITPGDVEHARAIDVTQRHLTDAGLLAARPLPRGATCVVCIGATIGKVGLTTADVSASNQQINAVVPREPYDPRYVFYGLAFHAEQFRRAATPGPVPLLSKGAFEQLTIFMSPDRGEQEEIAEALEAVDSKISLHRARSVLLRELFRTLLHQLMAGEIRVSDLNLAGLQERQAQPEKALA